MSSFRITSDTAPFEALTERERDILVLMAEGLSDREIAERSIVAYTTVKWYNRQIFNKLGVDNRRAAIQRARDLHLLDRDDEPKIIPKHNLPTRLTPFIGRQRELYELTHLLRDSAVRLVTILAPGGMGKTRLALAAAQASLLDFSNGVTFVPLAALSSPDSLVPFIAEQAGYPFQRDSRAPGQQLSDFFSNKNTLLVLDNFEHLLEGAPLVTELLQAGPGLKVIVTSREKLHLTAETVYTLVGLDYPEASAPATLESGAAQLFAQSARRARPDFVPDAVLPEIIRVCQLVQGMPLAIELAAAWAEVLTAGEIADEISHSLDFLATEMRDMPERLRSVRAVFESTWRRLPGEEQTAFMKLSVFRGGCTRQAALAVAGVGLRALTTLTDKALITWIPDDERYVVHELLRQYAAEQLEQAGLSEVVRDAHSAYYGAAIAARENNLKGGRQVEAIRDIAADLENVKAGLPWAIERRQYAVAGQYLNSLGLFYHFQSRLHEGMAFFGAIAEVLADQPEARFAYARALLWHGNNLNQLLYDEPAIK
ncbi:MAG: LuxR C-terminal-related transcriptional regulator, partial [Anaerolineae bacterium]|nr:LuxR C-terminal-related transcriptional regulator [Anaerolineae bacterium]